MSSMGKQDNIFEEGNLSGLPFTFNLEVTEVFEDMIRRSVPGYQTSLRLITQYAKNYYQPETNCYDIGCSLGASSISILKARQDAKITAIDNSEAMIKECRNRFEKFPQFKSINFIQEDVMESELGNASLVVVNYLIQFLDLNQREALLKKSIKPFCQEGCWFYLRKYIIKIVMSLIESLKHTISSSRLMVIPIWKYLVNEIP